MRWVFLFAGGVFLLIGFSLVSYGNLWYFNQNSEHKEDNNLNTNQNYNINGNQPTNKSLDSSKESFSHFNRSELSSENSDMK